MSLKNYELNEKHIYKSFATSINYYQLKNKSTLKQKLLFIANMKTQLS